MRTLSRHDIKSILDYLDAAAADAAKANRFEWESTIQWNIRMAKNRLLAVALGDIEVEPIEHAVAGAA